jgi:hypothetical protein
MEMIKNKVAESGIITFDLSKYLIPESEVALFDLKPFLFKELILKEKDYRESLSSHDWHQYQGKHVALFCSVDAIIPVWAYMLATTHLQPIAKSVFMGTVDELQKNHLQKQIEHLDAYEYNDKRVVIKGCGDVPIPDAAYVAITEKLRPVVKSLMYGEPCSTVPLYKKPAIKPAN